MLPDDQKSFIDNHLPSDVRDVQNGVVNIALTALLVLALPGVIAALSQAAESGWRPNVYAQAGAYLFILLGGIFRGRLPFGVRVGLLLTAGFVIAIGELLTWGLTGNSGMQFVLVSVFAVILLGTQMGLALAMVGTVASAVVGFGVVRGWLTIEAAGAADASWSAHVASYTATALLLVFSLGKVHTKLTQAIGGLRERGEQLKSEVTERTRAERQVRSLNEELEERVRLRTKKVKMLSKAIEHTPVSVVITDAAGVIEFTNDAFTRACGYSREEVAGQTSEILRSGKTPKATIKDLWDHLSAGLEWHGEFCNRKKSGEDYIEEAWISPLCDDDGNVEKFVAVKLDITLRRELEETLQRMSRTDALTNLANRRAFGEVLQREANRARRSGLTLSLLMLDVDYFKRYNDTYGHQAGDQALQRVAGVLTASARRGGDLSARYGGEEFAMILADTDLDAAEVVAETVRGGVSAQCIPHESSDTAGHVTVSIGTATMAPDASFDPAELIKLADTALYRAKAAGRNCIRSARRTQATT